MLRYIRAVTEHLSKNKGRTQTIASEFCKGLGPRPLEAFRRSLAKEGHLFRIFVDDLATWNRCWSWNPPCCVDNEQDDDRQTMKCMTFLKIAHRQIGLSQGAEVVFSIPA
jgi:hypothetical protein